jgi:glucosyl-dolichyl phosphate glucuronosyltransferase
MADLTVIVCTHNRPDALERCLVSIAALEDPVELIVVDSASDVPVDALAARFGARYHHETGPGLSRARNAGFRLASHPIVAFVDDDTEVRPDWARLIHAPFADPAVASVGGACTPSFGADRPRWLSDRLLQYAGITRFGTRSRAVQSKLEYPFGANLALRAGVVSDLGGFREDLGRTGASLLSGEESALLDAISQAGHTIWIEPRAVVRHHVAAERCRSSYYWRRLWWQGITRARADVSVGLTVRLLVAMPVRLVLWVLTGDRVYLYRAAETAGYVRGALQG